MKLICTSRFSNHEHDFKAGQEVIVSDEAGALLLRCSRGSFEIPEEPKPERKRKPDPVAAMSTETETGVTAPDRRARGGRRRTAKKSGGKA